MIKSDFGRKKVKESKPKKVNETSVTILFGLPQLTKFFRSVLGYLYYDFLATSDFDLVANYARELGVVLWELPLMRKMFVTPEGHEQIRSVFPVFLF